MKKLLVTCIVLLSLTACKSVSVKDTVETLDLEDNIPYTSSIIPIDTTTSNSQRNARVITKAKTYIAQSYSHNTSRHYDSYSLILPTRDGKFIDQGDASGWNSIALSSMCLINSAYTKGNLQDPEFDLQDDITQLWNSFKSSVITDEGTLIRHPDDLDGTSVSKDMMTMFFTMLATAHYTNCEPIKTDAALILSKFIDYGISHGWEYGLEGRQASSTTVLPGRHSLYDLSTLYGLNYTEQSLALSTSLEATKVNTQLADYINFNKYYCRQGYAGSCLRILNAGVYGNHLTFLTSVLYRVNALSVDNSVYSLEDTQGFLSDMAKVGQNVNQPNWLFVAGYRALVLSNPTYNDILKHLDEDWPDNLPTETECVKGRGGTVYVWQRVGHESCNGSNTEYVGNDFLFLFGLTKI